MIGEPSRDAAVRAARHANAPDPALGDRLIMLFEVDDGHNHSVDGVFLLTRAEIFAHAKAAKDYHERSARKLARFLREEGA